MFESFTKQAVDCLNQGVRQAHQFRCSAVSNHDILLGIFIETNPRNPFVNVLKRSNITQENIKAKILKNVQFETKQKLSVEELKFNREIQELIVNCYTIANDFDQKYVGVEHLILGLLDESQKSTYAYQFSKEILDELPYIMDMFTLRQEIIEAMGFEKEDFVYEKKTNQKAKYRVNTTKANSIALKAYTINLSKKANRGLFDPIIGRGKEIKRIINVLLRYRKNNPLLLGEPGVGKTAVIEGLTSALKNSYVNKKISELEFLELDLSSILAGSKYRGEFEERFKSLIEAFKNFDSLVLVIDEIHTLMGAGLTEAGGSDAAGILKPAIARKELKCIGATTKNEYRRLFQKNTGFDRLFQTITIGEPSKEESIIILQGIRSRYEKHHGIKILNESLIVAVDLSSQFINDRFLPDKALDLIDEGCSRAKMAGVNIPELSEAFRQEFQQTLLKKQWALEDEDFEKAILYRAFEAEIRAIGSVFLENFKEGKNDTILQIILKPEMIADLVTSWTGIPMVKTIASKDETNKYLKMEETLGKRVIGQKVAISSIAKAVRRARVGLKNPNRPIASFIFAGPTGVGKTELAKTLASFFFGSDDSMVRLDMSEYMERHNVSKLIGSPPGYVGYEEGGFLTEKVKNKPYSVVLFDEIEKAHPDVFNLLLQILEDGRLSDSQSRVIDFKNTFIILTSNIGSAAIQQETEELKDVNEDIRYGRLVSVVNNELKQHFRPEFLNRLDEIIVFQQLTLSEVGEITEILLNSLINRVLKNSRYLIKIEDAVKKKLTSDGFDPIYGARPLRRVIMNSLENKLASLFLETSYPEGSTIKIYLDNENEIILEIFSEIVAIEKKPNEKEKIEEIKEEIELEYYEMQSEYLSTVIQFQIETSAFIIAERAGLHPSGKPLHERGQIKSIEDTKRLMDGIANNTISMTDFSYMKAKDMNIDELEEYIKQKNISLNRTKAADKKDKLRSIRNNF